MKNVSNTKVCTSKGTRLVALTILMLLASSCATTVPQQQLAKPSPYSDNVFEISAVADRAYKASRWIEAAQHYSKLSELVPQDAYVWFRLGNTYVQQGAYQQAIVAYENSISRNAEQPKPWFNLSTAYLLKAQAAMQKSWSQMRADDPAKQLIATKLQMLNALMHSRIEDSIQETNY